MTSGTNSGVGEEPIARTAADVAGEAGRTAEQQAARGMDRAADSLQQVAEAVRQAGGGLREQQPQLASVADMAAEQVEKSSRYLRDHEPQEIVGGVESWARRQPALAIGGALALGLVVGRFLRSASPPASGMDGRSGGGYGWNDGDGGRYRSGYDTGYGLSSGYGSGGYASSGSGSSGYGATGYGSAGDGSAGVGYGGSDGGTGAVDTAVGGYGTRGLGSTYGGSEFDDTTTADRGDVLADESVDTLGMVEVVPDTDIAPGIDDTAAGTTRVSADDEGR
jgi:hypothetical protein